MKEVMEYKLLIDPAIKPENVVLESALGKNNKRFMEFVELINARNLVLEWHYYNDAKCWLGKILNKKKNLCWLSVWNTGFKLTFYFMEKNIKGIHELSIDEIKKMTAENKPVGKFIPIIILVSNKKKLDNGLKILEYKKLLK